MEGERLRLLCGQLIGPSWYAPLRDVVVEIDGATITGIDPPSANPADIDLSHATLLPGYVDAHTHFCRETDTIDDLVRKGHATLGAGFTTIRDLGSPRDLLFAYRDHLRTSGRPGPRVVACGRILSAPSPGAEMFGDMYRLARSEDQFREAVNEEVDRGADVIKVMVTGAVTVPDESVDEPQIGPSQLAAIVEESRRRGVPVAAHAEGLAGVVMAVEAGVDTIEHGERAHRSPETLRVMAEAGITLVPTVAVFDAVEQFGPDAATRRRAVELGEDVRRTVAAARDAGVPIAVGPDGVSPHIPAGSQATELRLLAEIGLTAHELMRAATTNGAKACRLPSEHGSVEIGGVADLVAFPGDPLSDLSVLWGDPELVVREGRRVPALGVPRPAE